MPATIVNYNEAVINYLEDVNYGMTKPQFNHLSTMIEGIISIGDNKSISNIAENIALAKDKSCIYRFLSQSPWDDELLNRNRISFLQYHLEHNVKPDTVGFFVIDDTTNLKDKRSKCIEGLGYHYSHTEGGNRWSHCVVTSNFVAGDYSIPVHYKPYYRKDKCNELGLSFQSKVDIAKEFVQEFKPPSNLKQTYVLIDCWYTGTPLMETALSNGYHVIGRLKSNRNIFPCGIKLSLSQFEKYIVPDTLDVVTVNGKDFKVYRYEGKVSNLDNAIVVISYEIKDGKLELPVYTLCTNIELDTETILKYYAVRWSIETSYLYFKESLGFNKYQIRSLLSIERYFLICFLAYNFLAIFRATQMHLRLKTLGEAIVYHKTEAAKEFVDFIYSQAINHVPLQNIYKTLRLAS